MEQVTYCDRHSAARYIQNRGFPCAASTLRKLACIGGGPAFRKFGRRVVYSTADLDSWIDGRLSKPLSSTSEEA